MTNVSRITVARGDGALAASMRKAGGGGLDFQMIDNRGVNVWPDGVAETLCTDATAKQTLRNFDGKSGYTLAQGQ
jgi:hypothetical protein